MTRPRVHRAGVAVALAITLTACTADSGTGPVSPDAQDSTGGTTTATPRGEVTFDPNDPDGDGIPVSPLEAILNDVNATNLSPAQQAAAQVERDTFHQEIIAQCMKNEGFDYTPYVVDYGEAAFSNPRAGQRRDDRAWVTQWGYGIIDFPGRDEFLTTIEAPSTYPPDPNEAYSHTLSTAEYDAWVVALYGPQAATASEGGAGAPVAAVPSAAPAEPQSWQDRGCWGQAEHAWELEHPDYSQTSEFQPLFDAVGEFYFDFYGQDGGLSRAMSATNQAWSDCLAQAWPTLPFDEPYPGFPTAEYAPDWFSQFVMNPFFEQWSTAGKPGDLSRSSEYYALADQEIPLALADLDCREATNYRAAEHDAIWTAEEQFIADHQAEFDALEAALATR
jgi:hypothetical protein